MDRRLKTLIVRNCIKEKCKHLLKKGNVYHFCDCDSNNRPPHFYNPEKCRKYLIFKVNINDCSHVIIMDKCALADISFSEDKKIDFLFISLKKRVICLVEMKSAKIGKRKDRRKKAYKQLEEVLTILSKMLPVEKFSVYAIACVGKRTVPAILASSSNYYIKFKKLGAKLVNGCEIDFPGASLEDL
jgi:hypothetical protein